MRKYTSFTFLALIILLSCQSNKELKNPPYVPIDIETVSDSLVLFGKNVISTALYERDLAISPDGDEIIYTLGDYKQSRRCLVSHRKEQGQWTEAEILNISGRYQDIEPFFSKDGNRLYFASNRPIAGDSSRSDYNIWYSDRADGNWMPPVALDSLINTRGQEFFPSVSDNGNLYFTATRADGIGREDIFKSTMVDGQFQSPVPLSTTINTKAFEFNAYVSPGENLIVFSSYGRADDMGGGDLYYSQKDSTGNWAPAKNLGELINSDKLDYCPFIDWRTGNFYFTSERMPKHENTLKSVAELSQLANTATNGHGNLYKTALDRVIEVK